MPTDYSQFLGLNAVPADHELTGQQGRYGVALSEGQIAEALRSEYARIQEFIETNRQSYSNTRASLRLDPQNLRIISTVGREQLFDLGVQTRGTGQPIFEWYAPRVNSGINKFREGINFIVNHSFGRGFDRNALNNGQRSVAIDPYTGHNPRRFYLGISQLTNPNAAASAATGQPPQTGIHHIISLRGDLVNSVSWDNSCTHGEGSGGRYPGLRVNSRSIGIEHEEWYAYPAGATNSREIEDHGPYNDAVYATDAFILKKLEAYTGKNFKVYLGSGETARSNIRNNVTGCFNHASSSLHADPGGEFFLPPEYELRVTNFRDLPETQNNAGAWIRRMQIWFSGVPTGTQISAYARIFNIANRLRNYNLQTEVFNPATNGGLVVSPPPGVTGSYASAAAQQAATSTLTGVSRATQLSATTRVGHYSAAATSAAAVNESLARQASRLANVAERATTTTVINNALAFDFSTGQWTRADSSVYAAQVQPVTGTPAPTTDVNPTNTPPVTTR